MCIIRYDWLIALYIFISLVRNVSFLIVKKIGVREEVSDVKKLLCKKILFVSWILWTPPLVHAPTQLTIPPSPTTPSTATACVWYTISNAWYLAIVGCPTSSQESVKQKSLFTFSFTLRTIYDVNGTAIYLKRCWHDTDNDGIISALLQHNEDNFSKLTDENRSRIYCIKSVPNKW